MKNKLLIAILLTFSLLANAIEAKQTKEIEVTVNQDGDKVTKKIIINGKELSSKEVKEFETSGKMKIININDGNIEHHKTIIIKTDSSDSKFDFEEIKKHLLITSKDDEKGNFVKIIKRTKGGGNVNIIEKKFIVNDNKPILGFMVDVQEDGWHVINVVDSSGAKEAGIQKGDIVKKIAGRDMTNKNVKVAKIKPSKYTEGEIVKVVLLRDNKEIKLDVEAKALEYDNLLGEINEVTNHFEWLKHKQIKEHDLSDKDIKVMVFSTEDDSFELHEDDINIVFPEDLHDINIFISDGKSTSKLLGKHHEMTALSDDLGKYFHTKGGVLVLNVDKDNVFGLKGGDVIKSINGNNVNKPKDVVKQLVKANEQEKIKFKVIRHKKSKTLKYNK